MAGDWMKIELGTPDKPEVVMMATHLDLDQDTVVGKLFRIWAWADMNSVDGQAMPITEAFLDRLALHKGFAQALRAVGWLVDDAEGKLTFPNFTRHNGTTAKGRAESNRRKARSREDGKCPANAVTNVTQNAGQKAGPEKRREEKNGKEYNVPPDAPRSSVSSTKPVVLSRPTLSQAQSAARDLGMTPEAAEMWWNTREASDWRKGTAGGGTTPIGPNWRADLANARTWVVKKGGGAGGGLSASQRQRPPVDPMDLVPM